MKNNCRPCTDEELVGFYCGSSFVFEGIINTIVHRNDLQWSELTVQATRMYRDSQQSVLSKVIHNEDRTVTQQVRLCRPLGCGSKPSYGEFLFMGRWKLGNPILYCAPKLAEWRKVRRKASGEGKNQCVLE
ncbi:meteorin-like protein [Tachypleus tridentatus]|uniref:meteorin-like protein n=1 Tax=Tachypleus tridentatus TaxID=6853 RepID=UPI003FD5F25F